MTKKKDPSLWKRAQRSPDLIPPEEDSMKLYRKRKEIRLTATIPQQRLLRKALEQWEEEHVIMSNGSYYGMDQNQSEALGGVIRMLLDQLDR